MESNSQTILEAVLKLPESEQVALVSQLLEHLSPHDVLFYSDDPALVNELDRRAADTEGGIPWSELKAEQ